MIPKDLFAFLCGKEPLLLSFLWREETVPDIELLQSVAPLTPFCCYKL